MTWQKIRTHEYHAGGILTAWKEVFLSPDGKKVPLPFRPNGPGGLPVYGLRAGWHMQTRKGGRDLWKRLDVPGAEDPSQYPPDATDLPVWIPGWRPHLYRIDELRAALLEMPDQFICFPEGEKDADTLASLGYVSVASAGGASSDPTDEELEALRGTHVVLFADNDRPGADRVERLRMRLAALCDSVRVVSFPELPKGGDVSDWISGMAEVSR